MSISINKLMDLASKNPVVGKDKKKFGTKELPDKMKGSTQLTADQYYNSVKGNMMPKNVGNILQQGTPDGSNAAPGNKTVQIPNFSRPDGAIDPNRIRELSSPATALPYRFTGYGLEGPVLFGLSSTAQTSSNSVGLIRKAQMSYQNRQTILQPRAPPPASIVKSDAAPPPSYDEATGDLTPYKKTDSELNETYN
jgi:hypothetical protein